ncbi:beta-ketoacyl-ACP synthase II [Xanthovirga aplysinae]|uniref:beta-ketoacyl-ACP synthase II n=1 Tax=Xanthovirga aplysinae TaxID=2529853 RepID=UPI0012BB9293|nr:beta-ketoacyl-ACP synthase II [Xanthovirga aplysinae]MTI30610.1 beta-ketoacyl-[acyl-carrier-protein] synthase II [Xanthovirga aplysinae]
MKPQRVVITGLGALTPIGNNVKELWENLKKGKSGAAPITKFDASAFKTQFACEVKEFYPEKYFDPKLLKRLDPYSQYALYTARQAGMDAQLKLETGENTRKGVIWASTNGGISTFEQQLKAYHLENDPLAFNPFFISRTIPDSAAGLISIEFNFKGVNFCPVSACSSASTAIIEAFNHIRWGKADQIITGGSEATITPSKFAGLNAVKALSQRNDSPKTASRPFCTERDGFVLGEGAAALVLESLEHAQKRGAQIYAEIVGTALTSDAYHMTATHPEGEGAFHGMAQALAEAEVSPEKIDYINAHGTSTKLGDISEIKAIHRLFGDSPQFHISATKSMTGHLLGACGAVEAVISTLAIREQSVPPTINTDNPISEIPKSFNFTLEKGLNRKIDYVMSNVFGFGGHNSSIIFKRYKEDGE